VGAGDVWITPGDAVEPGETAEQAASRELREKTGIESAELGPCVWTRVHRFAWDGQRYEQRERFFVARVEAQPRNWLVVRCFMGLPGFRGANGERTKAVVTAKFQ